MRAAVAHPGLQTADQLGQDFPGPAAIGHSCLHTFCNVILDLFLRQVISFTLVALDIRFQRGHAAGRLVAVSATGHDHPGAFIGPGQHAADHDRLRSGRKGLGHIARLANAAVSNDGNTILTRRRGTVDHGG